MGRRIVHKAARINRKIFRLGKLTTGTPNVRTMQLEASMGARASCIRTFGVLSRWRSMVIRVSPPFAAIGCNPAHESKLRTCHVVVRAFDKLRLGIHRGL